jgi:hypothetical protein
MKLHLSKLNLWLDWNVLKQVYLPSNLDNGKKTKNKSCIDVAAKSELTQNVHMEDR